MRHRLACALLLLPTVARAEPAAPLPAPRFELEASLSGGLLRAGPAGERPDSAAFTAVRVGGSFVTGSGVALVGGVQVGHGAASCVADGPCWEPAYDRFTLIDAGARWFYRPWRYAEATALLARTSHDYDGHAAGYHGAGAALALGWRAPLGRGGFIGFELRLHGWQGARFDRDDAPDVRVLGGGIALTAGLAP